jgi:hypothetical protein
LDQCQRLYGRADRRANAYLGRGNETAVGLYFTPSGFDHDKYDAAIRKLEEAGAGAPAGRTYHVALDSDGTIQVFDIWESQEQFEAFGQTLIPILSKLGVDPGQPTADEVHNVIQG